VVEPRNSSVKRRMPNLPLRLNRSFCHLSRNF
jgi:hypothetical protein